MPDQLNTQQNNRNSKDKGSREVSKEVEENANIIKKKKLDQESKFVKQKLKENKVIFFGLPILTVISVFVGLLFFIIPSIQFYFKYRSDSKILNTNEQNLQISLANQAQARNQSDLISRTDQKITEYIPLEPAAGDMNKIIQQTAAEYDLLYSSTSGVNSQDVNDIINGTSLENLSSRSELIERLTSGEVLYYSDDLGDNVKAYLIPIEVRIQGSKESFLKFIETVKKLKPLINVTSIDYSEEKNENGDYVVIALIKFESYAIALDLNKLEVSVPARLSDPQDGRLLSSLLIKTYNWDPNIINAVKDRD